MNTVGILKKSQGIGLLFSASGDWWDRYSEIFSALWYKVEGTEMIDAFGGPSLILSSKTLKYGRLYSKNALTGLAPAGWHVPTEAEITTLMSHVDGDGYKLREAGTEHWYNNAGTNETGFALRAPGYMNQSFEMGLTTISMMWTSTPHSIDSTNNRLFWFNYSSPTINWGSSDNNQALGVRLIRDDLTGYVAGETLTDPDGNVYGTVQIGTQVWLVENYASTKLANGTDIAYATLPIDLYNTETPQYHNPEDSEGNVFMTDDFIRYIYSGTITAPDVAAYKADDVNNTLYDATGNAYALTAGSFVSSDLERLPVEYKDNTPHDIYAIALLDSAYYASLTQEQKMSISNRLNLWAFYWGVWLDAGSVDKENRTF